MFKISLIERFLLILIAVHKVWESLFRLMELYIIGKQIKHLEPYTKS